MCKQRVINTIELQIPCSLFISVNYKVIRCQKDDKDFISVSCIDGNTILVITVFYMNKLFFVFLFKLFQIWQLSEKILIYVVLKKTQNFNEYNLCISGKIVFKGSRYMYYKLLKTFMNSSKDITILFWSLFVLINLLNKRILKRLQFQHCH